MDLTLAGLLERARPGHPESRKDSLSPHHRLGGCGPPVTTFSLQRRDRNPTSLVQRAGNAEGAGLRTTSAKSSGRRGGPHTCWTVSLGVCSQEFNDVVGSY